MHPPRLILLPRWGTVRRVRAGHLGNGLKRDGSDGTRIRDLRRDRLVPQRRRLTRYRSIHAGLRAFGAGLCTIAQARFRPFAALLLPRYFRLQSTAMAVLVMCGRPLSGADWIAWWRCRACSCREWCAGRPRRHVGARRSGIKRGVAHCNAALLPGSDMAGFGEAYWLTASSLYWSVFESGPDHARRSP
jgi:hypothetical protein